MWRHYNLYFLAGIRCSRVRYNTDQCKKILHTALQRLRASCEVTSVTISEPQGELWGIYHNYWTEPPWWLCPYATLRLVFVYDMQCKEVLSERLYWRLHGPLTRYGKSQVAHAPGMPGTFPPRPTSKETASKRSRLASRHVRRACAVMHVGITYPRWRGKRSRHSRRMHTHNFTYLARGP